MHWNRFKIQDDIEENVSDVELRAFCGWLLKMEKIEVPQGNPSIIATFKPRSMMQDLINHLKQKMDKKIIETPKQYWDNFIQEINSWKFLMCIWNARKDAKFCNNLY